MISDPNNPIPAAVPFDLQLRTRLVFGLNAVERVGELAAGLRARRVLLVTDPGIVSAGHAARVLTSLEKAGLSVSCFQEVQENPGTRCVEKCVEVARRSEIDTLVALGGGSSMDTAKGCNFILTNGGQMADYWGIGKATRAMLPLIAIPTTGGTGSECQSFALITDERTHQKMACGDPKAAARIAILDPALTVSQPPRVAACTGIDAIAHALETAVTTRRNPVSSVFSREAFRLTINALPRVIHSPSDLDARGAMLLGSAWAGTAIENSMLGAAHSAANPLTAHFGITHGHAVGLMLPAVVLFNASDPIAAQTYSELAAMVQMAAGSEIEGTGSALLARYLESIMDLAGLSRFLKLFGVREQDISRMANEAARQWTAQFNPRPVAAPDFEKLYTAALDPRQRPGATAAEDTIRECQRPGHQQLLKP
jgi:alcohol dehydrogenase